METSFQNYLKNFSLPLINLHGEILARIFPERPTAAYIWNEENGFYAVDTIKRFNRDFSNKTLKKNFQQSALRLRYLQDALRVHDTDLLIGVAPPKVRIYPEYVSDYLFNDVSSAIPFEHTYDFYLKKEGVNVILIEQELRELKKNLA